MIPVRLAPEPAAFDSRVRKRGLDAIAELVGETPAQKRRGPRRQPIAATRGEIPPDAFPPYWREVLPEMLESYNRTCAYLALHIERATGSPTVDHVLPKSQVFDQIYEWSNYRLACQLINSKKNQLSLALDPFSIEPGLFALELVEFQVIPAVAAAHSQLAAVLDTIRVLGLNMTDCCAARREYVELYELGPGAGGIDWPYLARRAPFVAQELRRQGRLLRGDQ